MEKRTKMKTTLLISTAAIALFAAAPALAQSVGSVGVSYAESELDTPLGDVEGDAAALGKPAGADAALGKTTFVTQLGIDGAKQRVRDLLARADSALSIFGAKGDTLRAAARFVAERNS